MIFCEISSLPISCGSQRRKRRDRRTAISVDSNTLWNAIADDARRLAATSRKRRRGDATGALGFAHRQESEQGE